MLKAYIKILSASGHYGDHILGKTVELSEKIDGSQFSFGKDENGKLYYRSKGTMINPDAVPNLFQPAVNHVLCIQDKIPNNTAFYCETLASPRHNTLVYSRVPKNHLMLYGATDFARTKALATTRQNLIDYAELLDIEPIPVLGYYTLTSLKQLADPALLNRESALGGALIEGVVCKQYESPMEFGGQVFPFTALKYVSEQFKEKHSNNPDWVPQKDKLQDLLATYKTEARWLKTIQHLRDDGVLTNTPKDIGPLMKELVNDLETECKEDFKEELYKIYRKQWIAKVQGGFPEFFKQRLLESASSIPN